MGEVQYAVLAKAHTVVTGFETISTDSAEIVQAIKYLKDIKENEMARYLEELVQEDRILKGPATEISSPIHREGREEYLVLSDKENGTVERCIDIIREIGAMSKFEKPVAENKKRGDDFRIFSQTRPEAPMVLSVIIPDWDAETHAGSLLAVPVLFRLASEQALAKYGKDLAYLFLEKELSIGGFSDAGSASRCSPVSLATDNSRGDINLTGAIQTPEGNVPMTLLLSTIYRPAFTLLQMTGRILIIGM